jgi:hypothetical protein
LPLLAKRSKDIPESESALSNLSFTRALSVMPGSTTDVIAGLSGDEMSITGPASLSCQPVFTGKADPAGTGARTADAVSGAELLRSLLHDAVRRRHNKRRKNFARLAYMGDNL